MKEGRQGREREKKTSEEKRRARPRNTRKPSLSTRPFNADADVHLHHLPDEPKRVAPGCKSIVISVFFFFLSSDFSVPNGAARRFTWWYRVFVCVCVWECLPCYRVSPRLTETRFIGFYRVSRGSYIYFVGIGWSLTSAETGLYHRFYKDTAKQVVLVCSGSFMVEVIHLRSIFPIIFYPVFNSTNLSIDSYFFRFFSPIFLGVSSFIWKKWMRYFSFFFLLRKIKKKLGMPFIGGSSTWLLNRWREGGDGSLKTALSKNWKRKRSWPTKIGHEKKTHFFLFFFVVVV